MRLDIELTRKGRDAVDGTLTWDSQSGALGGTLAGQVRALCVAAADAGHVVTDPQPTHYDVIDPLHEPRDMALVLSQLWRLPDEVVAFLPGPAAAADASVALLY